MLDFPIDPSELDLADIGIGAYAQANRGSAGSQPGSRHSAGSLATGRGLHSSRFRLNVNAFWGIGGTFRGCLGGLRMC